MYTDATGLWYDPTTGKYDTSSTGLQGDYNIGNPDAPSLQTDSGNIQHDGTGNTAYQNDLNKKKSDAQMADRAHQQAGQDVAAAYANGAGNIALGLNYSSVVAFTYGNYSLGTGLSSGAIAFDVAALGLNLLSNDDAGKGARVFGSAASVGLDALPFLGPRLNLTPSVEAATGAFRNAATGRFMSNFEGALRNVLTTSGSVGGGFALSWFLSSVGGQ